MIIFRTGKTVALVICAVLLFTVTVYAASATIDLTYGNSYTIFVSGGPANIEGNTVKIIKGPDYNSSYVTSPATGWEGVPMGGEVPAPGTATVTFHNTKGVEDDISDTITVTEEEMLVTVTIIP